MDWTVARSALILKTLYTRRRCGCWPSACAKALMAYSGSSFDAGRRALNVTVQKRSSSDNSTSSSKISERPLSSIRARKYVIATATASFTSVMIQVCHILLGGVPRSIQACLRAIVGTCTGQCLRTSHCTLKLKVLLGELCALVRTSASSQRRRRPEAPPRTMA